MANSSLLIAAKSYLDRYGWSIIPVVGKQATESWAKCQVHKPSYRQLIGHVCRLQVTGIAVVVGGVSDGLRVRDFDRAESYEQWAQSFPVYAKTLPTAKTSRGHHVFFRADMPEHVTNFEDGEMRAGRSYVVLPPSAHPDGHTYTWLIPPTNDIPFVPAVSEAGLLGNLRVSVGGDVPDSVRDAIARTLPERPGERVHRLWDFARRLKGIDALDKSATALESYVRAWHAQAVQFIRTKRIEETEVAFFDAWRNSQTAIRDDQPAFLMWAQQVLREPFPNWLQPMFFTQAGKRLVQICDALQTRAGDEPFFLAARTAGMAIGVDATHASALAKRMMSMGLLQLVDRGTHISKKATTWRFKRPDCSPEPHAVIAS